MNIAFLFSLPGDINEANCTTGISAIIHSLSGAIHTLKYNPAKQPLRRPVALKEASHETQGQKVQ